MPLIFYALEVDADTVSALSVLPLLHFKSSCEASEMKWEELASGKIDSYSWKNLSLEVFKSVLAGNAGLVM